MRTYTHAFLLLTSLLLLFSCKQPTEKVPAYAHKLQKHWKIQSSAALEAKASEISSKAYRPNNWTDAQIPGTILYHLKEAGKYQDLYVGRNLEKVDTAQFRQAWWYRREFNVHTTDAAYQLLIKGINYKADVWLNGAQIADKQRLNNAFRQYALDINPQLQQGTNVLAVKVYPPRPGDFSIGFVDWNPTPPDQNMGIFRDVILKKSKAVSMQKPFVASTVDTATLNEARLHISVRLKNHSDEAVNGLLTIETQGETLEKEVSLKAREAKKIVLTPEEFAALHLKNPALWWPAALGEPTLHSLKAKFSISQKLSDKQSINYGIRSVSDYYTEDGHRGFRINGQKILIKGGGWVDDLMLGNTGKNLRAQLEYVRHMNLNTVRLEGFWGKDHRMYELCDSLGILLMAGWSCHWEWASYLGAECHPEWGGITSPEEIKMMSKAWRDQVVWLRNHPSIFTWLGGSDMYPKPELERNYLKIFETYDSTRVFLPSAKEWDKPISGPSGTKMRSPYAYTPPVYWFTDTAYGGAFGFNTETGPGAQVPVFESIKKMIPEQDLWPPNAMWKYHSGRNEFNTLDRYHTALKKRYGWADNVKSYAMKAQVLNYELMRPMFEAFSVNKYKATGVIQWMLNSAWPEMYWQLYDSYLMPTGAFYAARKGSAPLHLIYNYGDYGVYLSNDYARKSFDALKAHIEVLDLQGNRLHSKTLDATSKPGTARKIHDLSEQQPQAGNMRFVRLRLTENDALVHQQLYWISGKKDQLDYEADVKPWYYYTPSKQYADFKALNTLPDIKPEATVEQQQAARGKALRVHLKNTTDHTAFFNELVLKNQAEGTVITPVFWSDNFVTLFPGEERTLTVRTPVKKALQVDLRGWNVTQHQVYPQKNQD